MRKEREEERGNEEGKGIEKEREKGSKQTEKGKKC